MANKRLAAGWLLKKLGLERMDGPMTKAQCLGRAQALEARANSGKLAPSIAEKARKQASWYRWRSKQFPTGERRGRVAA